MHFKSLELYGFKSFAGRTKIDFEPGITAIVGPNGSGKSNCLDALKWVLGEQSAKDLRGANMEDVIFNGTDTKDPVGFAEVSLTLSNESKFLPIEYNEVVITRRLFRSGDSEYLLNKNQVRLKDILELFMGTGVGTSAYSIIEQGKIDMIISSKPEDRRYIFEEASGIIKYKSKKREAARKLEYTENNLLRVGDIIEEVRRQIGSIERQAKKAERYKEGFERLKTLDARVAFLEFKKLNEEKQNLGSQGDSFKADEAALLAEVQALGSRLAEQRVKQAAIDARLTAAQFKEMELTSNVERSNDKIKLDEERHRELEALKQSLLNEQALARKACFELTEQISSLTKEREAISGGRAQKELLLNQKRAELKCLEEASKQNKQNIRTEKLKIVDVLSVSSRKRNELVKLSSDLSNLSGRERRLKSEEEEVKKGLERLKIQIDEINAQIGGLEERIDKTKKANAGLESDLDKKEAQLSETEKTMEAARANALSLESKLAVFKDMVRRYEGFGSGSKAILIERQENRLTCPGVHGAIADLINVKKGYEAAVEASLGDLLQCIVVENRETALVLINYLKARNLGKATIVALDSIALPNHSKAEGRRLIDFVETDARFKNLMSALLGDTSIVDDLNDARGDDGKFVTLSGEVFQAGFLTGGVAASDREAGILSRRHQIEELQNQIASVKEQIKELEARKASLTKEGNELLEKINAQTETIRQDELALANKKSQKENIGAAFKKLTDEISVLALELEEVCDELGSLKTRQASFETELKRLDEEHNSVQNTIASAQAFVEKAITQKEGLLVEITRNETELGSVTEQEKNFLANLKMQEDLLGNQKALLNEKEKNFNDAAIRQEELKKEIDALRAVIENAVTEKERQSVEFQEVRRLRTELEGLIGQMDREFNEKQTALNGIKDKAHALAMAQQENSFKTETLKTRISQQYKIELEQGGIEIEEAFNLEAANSEISELREKLEKMGPVNLVAIEEHQELKERFDFLTKQKEDLINAKESLLEAIKKINKTTRELFMDTFQKVRVEFKEYFKYLFGGGQAELVLMDEEDVLECGIEIMARPPGKKLQSISLLSGGEKALTAIALLFSIFKVKPSPFCVLDEVDAPLDESNIGRFTKLLSEFTKTSQFIVITHNKKTISMADVMYGITMQQSGVSKVVSVKFAKEHKKAEVAAA